MLGNRYQILQLLGEGGMGAVYKARDCELDRLVALKIIRPSLALSSEILHRFKQELILARQVTHRNVIRIFDLGEADGVKFITMEHIDGETLKAILLREGKLTPLEASNIIRQVCRGLEAAHAEGVIHRDLKPQNIMRDAQHRIVVMDFGVAHLAEAVEVRPARPASMRAPAMQAHPDYSQTGVLVGTPAYMAPEQALGKETDARSDVFAVGIIFFELLTGQLPFKVNTPEMLLQRTREKAKPVHEIDPKVPRSVSKIVERCLEPQRDIRYQSATQVLDHLDAWMAPPWRKAAKWIAAAAAVLLLVGTQIMVQRHQTVAQHAPVSVLVSDFKNGTGDAVFDGTLEPAFSVAMEGASFITSFNRGQAHKLAAQVQPGATILDEEVARLIATREGINTVIGGSIARQGDSYRVAVRAIDGVTGKVIATNSNKVQKKDVLVAMGKLAVGVRKALGDKTPESVQLAAAETFSTGSLEAAHEYGRAQDMLWAGKWEESIPRYKRAIELDSKLARAYAGIASAEINLGRRQESEKYYQQALAHLDQLTEREKYRTRGGYYTMRHEPRKAIDEYTALLNQYPYDMAGHTNLALNYFYMRNMAKALSEGQRTTTSLMDRNNVALYMLYAGDFDSGIKQARDVLKQSPGYVDAYAAVAMGEVGGNKVSEAIETYREIEKISPRGASVAAAGLADVALFQGRVADAQNILRRTVPADLSRKDEDAASIKLTMLAEANLLAGSKQQALADAERAMTLNKGARILFSVGRIYNDADLPAKALVPATQLSSHVEPEPQMYGKLLQGEIALRRHDPKQAIALFEAAQSLTDSWLGRFDLGRAYLEAGLYAEADSEFENCLKRRGEVTAVFLDDVPTFRYLPPVYYYLGRVQEGLKSPAAADSYKTFLSLKDKGDHDPLVADASRRLASP
jgi:eukaryotic-like serine/threonine-protein kinase